MGIRKKISLGFLCLALMLSFSGMISLFELNRLSLNTRDLLQSSSYSMALSKRMLDAVQEQNTSLLQMIVLERENFDSSFINGKTEFENALIEATRTVQDRAELDSIYITRENYNELVSHYFDDTKNTDIEWFLEMYKTSYLKLTSAIKNHMMNSQHSVMIRASQLKNNAYRAIIPGIITLCVAILMVLMFAYLLDLYYTRPIMGITNGLRDFIAHKIPFNVKMEGHDEIYKLREYIETLISMFKNKKPE